MKQWLSRWIGKTKTCPSSIEEYIAEKLHNHFIGGTHEKLFELARYENNLSMLDELHTIDELYDEVTKHNKEFLVYGNKLIESVYELMDLQTTGDDPVPHDVNNKVDEAITNYENHDHNFNNIVLKYLTVRHWIDGETSIVVSKNLKKEDKLDE